MIWLDNVISMPSIGIRLSPNLSMVHEFQKCLSPYMDFMVKKFQNVNVTPHPDGLWGYEIKADNYIVKAHYNDIAIRYAYFISQENKAGSLPKFPVPDIRTYSTLYDETRELFCRLIECIEKIDSFYYDRIGIVADSVFDSESIPPGFGALIEHMGKPWGRQLSDLNSTFCIELEENEESGIRDVGLHSIKFAKETLTTNGYLLKLDWQRYYSDKIPFKAVGLERNMESCRKMAFEYFESFGEGNLK